MSTGPDIGWLHAVIDVPTEQLDAASTFWRGALAWPVGESWPGHPELRSFEPSDGDAYVHLQEIDSPPRVHLDLESADPAATVELALAAGASRVAERERWQTLASPGGLPFCVLPASEHVTPAPTEWRDGHRTRLVQVCIDSPVVRHETEVGFWRSLLAGRWVDSPAREFAGKWHNDAGSPLQLLFQRLDEQDGPVRAHLDHGTDDLPTETRRLLALGAVEVGPGRGWHALRDPVGLAFCVTENSPELVARRELG